jgi:hypothetical protein
MKPSRIIRNFSPEPTDVGVRLALGLGSIHRDEREKYTKTHPALGCAHSIHLHDNSDKASAGIISRVSSLEIQEDLFTNQPFFADKAEFRIVRMQTSLGWEEYHELYS